MSHAPTKNSAMPVMVVCKSTGCRGQTSRSRVSARIIDLGREAEPETDLKANGNEAEEENVRSRMQEANRNDASSRQRRRMRMQKKQTDERIRDRLERNPKVVLDQLASDWLRDGPKSQTSALLRSKEHTPTEK